MNFCILIELSKKKISFLYNRSDGESKFAPFVGDGHALPLAIYCLGNDIQIGQFALDESINHNPHAYTDVFQTMKTVGTYKFKSEEWPYNTLLLNAVQKYLAYFFDSVLIGEHGRLEKNIADMPLCFVFNSDINENERLFVKNCFTNGGYSNVATMDYDQLVIEASRFNTGHAACVTSDGQDLYISFYETATHKYLGGHFMRHCGKDPRSEVAIQKLWESLGYDNYYLNFDKERDTLAQIAEDFLSSGEVEFQDQVLFSDGRARECFLSLRELNDFRFNDDGKMVIDIKNTLAKLCISPFDTTIVLKGKAANNGYFLKTFKNEFDSVTNVNDSFHSNVLSQLLKDIKEANYRFTEKPKDIYKEQVGPQKDNVTEPVITPALKRFYKTKTAEINGKIRINDFNGALSIIESLKKELQKNNISIWNNEINDLENNIKGSIKKVGQKEEKYIVPENPPHNQKRRVETDSKRYQREVRISLAEINGKRRAGDIKSAQQLLETLKKKLHALDIHAFDNEMITIAGEITPILTSDITQKEIKNKEKNSSKAETLFKEGHFAEAKKAFAEEKNSDMAHICSELIKSKRSLALYHSGLDAARKNKNITSIKSVLKELEKMKALYNKYGLDSEEINILIRDYNSI